MQILWNTGDSSRHGRVSGGVSEGRLEAMVTMLSRASGYIALALGIAGAIAMLSLLF